MGENERKRAGTERATRGYGESSETDKKVCDRKAGVSGWEVGVRLVLALWDSSCSDGRGRLLASFAAVGST